MEVPCSKCGELIPDRNRAYKRVVCRSCVDKRVKEYNKKRKALNAKNTTRT